MKTLELKQLAKEANWYLRKRHYTVKGNTVYRLGIRISAKKFKSEWAWILK